MRQGGLCCRLGVRVKLMCAVKHVIKYAAA